MSFEYNSSGLRTKKVVGDKTTEYYYSGDLLVAQFDGETLIRFIYSPNGEVVGFTNSMVFSNGDIVDGDYCYYVKNVQGDILGFYSMFHSIFREYTYDSWGNITGVYNQYGRPVTDLDDPAYQNPLRYRGYYYDDETGLYYLNSRYYNPEWGTFISADSVVSGTGEVVNGYNLYSYCFNNPVNLTDNSGCWPQWVKNAANWINNKIVQPVKKFFSPNTNSVSGSFQNGILKGSGSATLGYSDSMFRNQGDVKKYPKSQNPSISAGVYAKASVANVSGKVGTNNNLSLSIKVVGDGLTASGVAGVNYQNGLGLIAKAKAAVFSGRATIEMCVSGWEFEFGVTADALSAGIGITLGVFDGSWEFKPSASLGVGGGLILRVKPPQ